jgi:hypothetical protein
MAHGHANVLRYQRFDQGGSVGELGRESNEFDGIAQVGGAVDGGGGDAAGGEEGGVVGAIFGGMEVGTFDVGAEEGGGVRD